MLDQCGSGGRLVQVHLGVVAALFWCGRGGGLDSLGALVSLSWSSGRSVWGGSRSVWEWRSSVWGRWDFWSGGSVLPPIFVDTGVFVSACFLFLLSLLCFVTQR